MLNNNGDATYSVHDAKYHDAKLNFLKILLIN